MKTNETKNDLSAHLTRREAEVLAILAAFPEELLIYERGSAYMGLQAVGKNIVFSLIRKMLISEEEYAGGAEHYQINDTGRNSLKIHWGIE